MSSKTARRRHRDRSRQRRSRVSIEARASVSCGISQNDLKTRSHNGIEISARPIGWTFKFLLAVVASVVGTALWNAFDHGLPADAQRKLTQHDDGATLPETSVRQIAETVRSSPNLWDRIAIADDMFVGHFTPVVVGTLLEMPRRVGQSNVWHIDVREDTDEQFTARTTRDCSALRAGDCVRIRGRIAAINSLGEVTLGEAVVLQCDE